MSSPSRSQCLVMGQTHREIGITTGRTTSTLEPSARQVCTVVTLNVTSFWNWTQKAKLNSTQRWKARLENKAFINVKWMNHGHISVWRIDAEPKMSHKQLWSTQLLTDHCELCWTKPTGNKFFSFQTKQSFIIFIALLLLAVCFMLNHFLWRSRNEGNWAYKSSYGEQLKAD